MFEAPQEESDGVDSVDDLEESADVNMPHSNEGMMLVKNLADLQPPEKFITLVGGAETFESLMKCVESDGVTKMYLKRFQNSFESEEQKDLLIRSLLTNDHFFKSFIEATSVYIKDKGKSALSNKVAFSWFQGNQKKLDIKKLL